ncbi:MAG TPA: GntR family transcriptional regulator [Terracidiphilus sp.]|nr:GntR family transcriptional regulator [Terracidiphilus sp.]
MRLWLNRTSEISLREQLSTQVILGILCGEIRPGERLPSTRELARRFGIHANTASATYRRLEEDGWVELRHGSGIYARKTPASAPASPQTAVDRLIGELVTKARRLGAPESLLRARLQHWLAMKPPARWLLIEPDEALRRIVLFELEQTLVLPLSACAPDGCGTLDVLDGARPLVLPSKAAAVRKLLPPETELTVLHVHPVSPELDAHFQRYLPGHATDLIGIASRWTEFQRIAQTMLVAAGLRPESLLVRDPAKPAWKRGLDATSAVVCDSLTALELPKNCHAIVFRLIDAASVAELKALEARLTGPPVLSAPGM